MPRLKDAEELKGKVVKKFEKSAPEFVSWLEDNVDEGLKEITRKWLLSAVRWRRRVRF